MGIQLIAKAFATPTFGPIDGVASTHGGFPMLTYKSTGIQKFIFDRLTQIHDEIVVVCRKG